MAPRYPLEVEAFLVSQATGSALAHGSQAMETGASPHALSCDAALSATGLPISDVPNAGASDCGATEGANLSFSFSVTLKKGKVSV